MTDFGCTCDTLWMYTPHKCVCVCVCMCAYIYIYIYVYAQRERETYVCIYIYIYYTYVHTLTHTHTHYMYVCINITSSPDSDMPSYRSIIQLWDAASDLTYLRKLTSLAPLLVFGVKAALSPQPVYPKSEILDPGT